MAVQSQQYPAAVMHLPENFSSRVRALQYEVDQRGFLSSGANHNHNHNSSNNNNNNNNSHGIGNGNIGNVFLGKNVNAFQIPSPVNIGGSNQYHLFNQLTGARHGYNAAALMSEKDQIHASNVLMVGSRKRSREQIEEFCSPWPNPPHQQQQFVINAAAAVTQQLDTHPGSVVNPQSTVTNNNGVSTGLRLASFEDDHRLRSASPVSTSGRADLLASKPIWPENCATNLQQERDEVTQLLRIQNEQLKAFIEEKQQRHARQVMAAAEEGFQRQLRDKDEEIEKMRRQNQELMDRFTQLNAEAQHWQTKVRNTEAMVTMLRSNLAHAQQATATANAAAAAAQQQQQVFPPQLHPLLLPKEGCGDSDAADDCASSYVDDLNDAHTRACLENKELRDQRTCRVCRSGDVSMLLLPCRHLCLCSSCEVQLLACPLCRTPKNASVQVYMS